ncbi:cell division protein ZapE [Mesorhizobium microcysteis]|uniref:Cell division protein ZapE n=1 Tax=Neoaquamicrobium microcysteis TaxID=2682781 RepID=A0A5D4GSW4_9HYPH|nr:cell division protein ZapE [Mesorhizobium microcysteis]TYR31427.1 cell division protein ZapE [Mesorhizobium microcysteis]
MSSLDGLPTFRTVRQDYQHLEQSGTIVGDTAQLAVVDALDRLIEEIASKRLASKSSALGWLFAKRKPTHEPVKGLYVHGGVGRGKTMLMDMFFERVTVKRKRRAHFNDFMADVHDRIQKHREMLKRGETKETDPIPPVARALAQEAWVLCFDEFTVTDIADAMVLSRLFSSLFSEGVVLVATSNVAPRDLYRDGLNRALFEPFIGILERHTRVMALDGPTDYRRRNLDRMQVYISPLGEDADALMDEAWEAATAGHVTRQERLAVKGREVVVPRANGTAARFTFADLCEKPLGARDYLAIAAHFDTLFIDRIPVMGQERRNEAKRFILLVDTLYDQKMRLVASAEASPERLYAGTSGTEAFEFARTASRLTEMQSREWLDAAATRAGAD